jgi:hypothetical protein
VKAEQEVIGPERGTPSWWQPSLRQEAGNPAPGTPSTARAACVSGRWGTPVRERRRRQKGRGGSGDDGQERAGASEFLVPRAIGQQAVVTNPHEAGRHDMKQETAEEFGGLQFHDPCGNVLVRLGKGTWDQGRRRVCV